MAGDRGLRVAAALLYGFLDPTFGIDAHSVATFVGMLVAIAGVTFIFAIPTWRAHRRRGDPARLKVVPLSLAVAVVCVLISRVTGFQPGYLYGLLIGLAFAHERSGVEEGRATAGRRGPDARHRGSGLAGDRRATGGEPWIRRDRAPHRPGG